MAPPTTDEADATQSYFEDQEQEQGFLALTSLRKVSINSMVVGRSQGYPATALPTTPIPKGIGSLDPFSSGGVHINSGTAGLLRYFETTWAQTAFQPATTSNQSQRFDRPETLQVIKHALADPLIAHAFLAAVAMRMATVHSTYSSAEKYAATALRQVRNSITRQDDHERIMVSILFLAAYETYCFNLEGTKMHLRALKRMGAEEHLTGYLKALCQHIDLFSASSSLSAPIFSMPLTIYMGGSEHTTVGHGFSEYTEHLGLKMCEVVANIISCANVAEDYKRRTLLGENLSINVAQMVAWSECLTYQLLEQMPGSLLKECCIIALLMWLSYLPASVMASSLPTAATPNQSFLKMIPGRGSGLVRRLTASATLDTHLHLWILAVGIVCCVDADDTQYCAVAFTHLAHQLGVSAVDVRDRLRHFLWLDHFDLIDYTVLMRLLDPDLETSERALRTVVGWAATTKGGPSSASAVLMTRSGGEHDEKESHVRVTNRPSNWHRLGA